MATTKKATEIGQATICKVTIKSTGYSFYQVKSDSTSEYYQLHCDGEGQYKCNCGSYLECKHERALNSLIDAQVAMIFSCEDDEVPAAESALVATAPVAPVVAPALISKPAKPIVKKAPVIAAPICKAVVPSKEFPLAERGALNGNRPFSLFLH